MYPEKNKISRSNFLKTTGLAMGGVFTHSQYACSGEIDFLKQLVIEGKTGFSLVLPLQATIEEKEAAQQLQLFLSKIAQELNIVYEQEYVGRNAIYLGNTDFARAAGVSSLSMEDEAYVFKRNGDNLLIGGGGEKGLLNGVYSLLEFFGYRKYSANDFLMTPKAKHFSFPKDDLKVPLIKYRTTNYYDAKDKAYSGWHKLSSTDSWGLFVHTFEVLVPPEKYGKAHPEYYSLIDGERNPVTQLCLSNEEV
ncbi:MAG: DUF4838 domain-containing protein, partial [Flavobacteriaceae bacterium]